jgi:alkanesulfonate monooxygenase SsuD/methylene tetrahydromethanopterin reductase-like flavin-dependent oxidoreductase (luciferase family)
MHFRGAMFFTDYSMSAMELARAIEERGFESVWAPEHSPVSCLGYSQFRSNGGHE